MKAAVIGSGVIGAGWACRFLLAGWDVAVYDPAPAAGERLEKVLEDARRALTRLLGEPPDEGVLARVSSLDQALQGADWVQENLPERLPLKREVLDRVVQQLDPGVIVGSSTSGFTPGSLNEGLTVPDRVLVCHPFNPVYLLPLVEVVATADTPEALVERAMTLLTGLRMRPLRVRREIEAHIADRLLEAIWRESLWLVHDGIATTGEIDDAIRYGFGLRFAQMGLFESYRIAGGEGGMHHFLAQFGDALQWPWTKLTDVPELDEELISRIVEQSDAQSGEYSIRELERLRDDNLVAILRALQGTGWGAGALLADERRTERDPQKR